jgi:hypothetical protein
MDTGQHAVAIWDHQGTWIEVGGKLRKLPATWNDTELYDRKKESGRSLWFHSRMRSVILGTVDPELLDLARYRIVSNAETHCGIVFAAMRVAQRHFHQYRLEPPP